MIKQYLELIYQTVVVTSSAPIWPTYPSSEDVKLIKGRGIYAERPFIFIRIPFRLGYEKTSICGHNLGPEGTLDSRVGCESIMLLSGEYSF